MTAQLLSSNDLDFGDVLISNNRRRADSTSKSNCSAMTAGL
jgi:hypothetical protein